MQISDSLVLSFCHFLYDTFAMSKDAQFIAVFGQTMREFRIASGFSQYHLANISGCSRRHINRIEAGDQEARISTLHKLAQALGVTLADIGAALDERLEKAGIARNISPNDTGVDLHTDE